jgi:hypothetical protein
MMNQYTLTGHALTQTIAVTVSSSTAGMVAGAWGPGSGAERAPAGYVERSPHAWH